MIIPMLYGNGICTVLPNVLDFKVWWTNFEFMSSCSWSWAANFELRFDNKCSDVFKEIWILAPFITSFPTSADVQNSNAGRKPLVRHTLILKSVSTASPWISGKGHPKISKNPDNWIFRFTIEHLLTSNIGIFPEKSL